MTLPEDTADEYPYDTAAFSPASSSFFFAFVIGPLYLRSTSVSSPFLRMGEKWDLQGSYLGLTWEEGGWIK